jgi:hypothetical protein
MNYQIQRTLDLVSGFQDMDVAVDLYGDQVATQPADIPYQRWKFEAPITDDKSFFRVRAVSSTDN